MRFLTLFFCIGGCFWGAVAQGACTGYRTGSTCDRCLDGYKFDPANLSGDCIVAPASSKDDGAFGTGVSFVVIGAVAGNAAIPVLFCLHALLFWFLKVLLVGVVFWIGIALLCGGCCYYFHHQRHLENQINPRQIQIAVAPSIPDKASR